SNPRGGPGGWRALVERAGLNSRFVRVLPSSPRDPQDLAGSHGCFGREHDPIENARHQDCPGLYVLLRKDHAAGSRQTENPLACRSERMLPGFQGWGSLAFGTTHRMPACQLLDLPVTAG